MFSKIKTKIKKYFSINKRNIFFVIWFLAIFLLSTEVTFAEDTAATKLAGALDSILKVISSLLAVMTVLASMFLDPAWISWSLFWLDKVFKEIWVLVSNVVYFIFAFILIWIAFMNIVWKWQDKYQLKTALPKFVVWILIVPFTWFFIQFVLSISAILTMAALTLPADSFSEYQKKINDINLPKECTIDLASTNSWSYFTCNPQKMKLWNLLKWEDWNSSIYWLIASYTYWVISIDKLDTIDLKTIASWVKDIWSLIVKIWFDLIFILVYAILMITLGIALATRWIYLWIYTIISPVFWLMYFFWKKDWWWEWFIKNFSITEFIALAMVPVYTMLALSFWLLFMFVIWSSISTPNEASNNTSSVSDIVLDDKWVKYWDFRLNIEWALLFSVDTTESVTSLFWKVKNWALWVVWTLILQMFSIAVLWIAIMAALKSSSITTAVTQPIRDFWSQVWWLISKMPTYAPIFPGGQSMQSMKHVWAAWESYFSSKTREKSSKFMEKTWLFQDQSLELRNSAAKYNDAIKATWKLHKDELNHMKDMLTKTDSVFKLTSDPEAYKAMLWSAELLKDMGKLTEDDLTGVKDKNKDSIAKVIWALDELWRTSWIDVDVVPWKNLTIASSSSSVVTSQLKANSDWTATPETPEATSTKWAADDAQKASELSTAILAASVVTVNNEAIIDMDWSWSKPWVTISWFDMDKKEVTKKAFFKKSILKLWIDVEQKDQFDALMTKLWITDNKKIVELKTALNINWVETENDSGSDT